MDKPIKYYNKLEFCNIVFAMTNYRIPPQTLWFWETSGKFEPSGYMKDGKRLRPIYTHDQVKAIVEKIEQSKADNKFKIVF